MTAYLATTPELWGDVAELILSSGLHVKVQESDTFTATEWRPTPYERWRHFVITPPAKSERPTTVVAVSEVIAFRLWSVNPPAMHAYERSTDG